jgi:hypothetical protein
VRGTLRVRNPLPDLQREQYQRHIEVQRKVTIPAFHRAMSLIGKRTIQNLFKGEVR